MKISRFSFVAALAIVLVGAPASSAAVKAGASCKKAGQVTTVAGSKFTCVKKSGKLVWVKSVVKSPAAVAPTATATPSPSVAGYTMEKVKANGTSSSCWSAINGNVYDLTKWINSHPGGSSAIISLCGKDGTADFLAMHRNQGKPEARLAGFLLGPLAK